MTSQEIFRKSAIAASGVGAPPRDWIEAQFEKFREYTKFFGRRIVPQPAQLVGIKAVARYVQWKTERDASEYRQADRHEKSVRGFKHDERKLKALMRMRRMIEVDVLAEFPDQFSKAFLRHKGIYDVVAEKLAA